MSYNPVGAATKVGVALMTANAWESTPSGCLFRTVPLAGTGGGPRNEWYLARISPTQPDGTRQVVISVKDVFELEFFIQEKNEEAAKKEADRLILEQLKKRESEITIRNQKWDIINPLYVEAPPVQTERKAPENKTTQQTAQQTTEKKVNAESPSTQDFLWTTIKDAAAQQVARQIELVLYTQLKRFVLAKFPAARLADMQAVDEMIMLAVPLLLRHLCHTYPDGFGPVKAEYVGHIKTACEFAVKANANKIAELTMDLIIPFLAQLTDLGKELESVKDGDITALSGLKKRLEEKNRLLEEENKQLDAKISETATEKVVVKEKVSVSA